MPVKSQYPLSVALLRRAGYIAKTKGSGHMVSGTTDVVRGKAYCIKGSLVMVPPLSFLEAAVHLLMLLKGVVSRA